MERLLSRLDRRLGRYAPENITLWLVGISGLCIAVAFARPDLLPYLWFNAPAILGGEVWRVATCLFAPMSAVGEMGIFFAFFGLWFLYTMGTSLEAQWGALRFDLFVFAGAIATVLVGFLFGAANGQWLAAAIFLAFAAEFPDFEIQLFLILPIKVKWVGLLTGAVMIWGLIGGGAASRMEIAVALIDLALFCGGTLLDRFRGVQRTVTRTSASRTAVDARFTPAPRKARVCAKCGRSDKDDPRLEFRVCDCQEKCGGKLTEYCIDHARTH